MTQPCGHPTKAGTPCRRQRASIGDRLFTPLTYDAPACLIHATRAERQAHDTMLRIIEADERRLEACLAETGLGPIVDTVQELLDALAAVRSALTRLDTVIMREGTLGLSVPLDTLAKLAGDLDGVLGAGPPPPSPEGPYQVTVAVTLENVPDGGGADKACHEVAAAALLGIALADQGNPEAYLYRPHAASESCSDEDGPDGDRRDVHTVTLRIIAEYTDLLPVVVGRLPGRVRDIVVLSVD